MRNHTLRSLTLAAVCLGACVGGAVGTAHAERRNPLDGQPAIRYRKEIRRLRLEITPSFTTDTNQQYKHAFGVGGTFVFHFLDYIGVGFEGEYLFNTSTALESEIRKAIRSEANLRYPNGYTTPGPNPTLAQHDQRVLGINATMSPFVQITPFSGKFSLFSAAFAWYDLYAKAGLGLVNYTQTKKQDQSSLQKTADCVGTTCDPNLQNTSIYAGLKVGGMVGVGVHLYFTDWLGLQLELRDYIVKADRGGGDVNGDRKLTNKDATTQNNIFFTAGLTFVLPPKARITR